MKKRLTRLIAVSAAVITLSGAFVTQAIVPASAQEISPSQGLRGPGPNDPPPTGTPRPTYVRPGLPQDDFVCVVYDYIKKICVAWKRKHSSSDLAPNPIPNVLWTDGSQADVARKGYYGVKIPDVANSSGMICTAYDYTYGQCAGWESWRSFRVYSFPIINYIWVDPATLDFIRNGYYSWYAGSTDWWWYCCG